MNYESMTKEELIQRWEIIEAQLLPIEEGDNWTLEQHEQQIALRHEGSEICGVLASKYGKYDMPPWVQFLTSAVITAVCLVVIFWK